MRNKKNTLIYDWLILVKVIEKENFSTAAAELHITASSVSKVIAKLESVFGSQLISRNAHRFEVTEAGKVAYDKAIIICETYHNLLARLEHVDNEIRGTIRLSAPSIVCDRLASKWIIEYTARHPDVVIHLLSNESGNYTSDSPEFDDIVLKSGFLDSPDLIHKSLNSVQFGIYASPDYLSQHSTLNEPEDMDGHDILKLSHPSLKPPLNLLKHGESRSVDFKPGSEMISNNISSLLHMARENRGICIAAPCWVAGKYVDEGSLVQLFPEWSVPALQVNLVWRYRKYYSPLFQDFSLFVEGKWNEFFTDNGKRRI